MNTNEITEINTAITQSINLNGIVYVDVKDQNEALEYLDQNDKITDLDWSKENDGSYDVCGARHNEEFRIRFVKI